MMNRIERVKECDLPDVYRLMREYIIDFYGCAEPARMRLEGLIRTLLKGEAGVQFIARDEEGQALGFATLYFTYSTLRARPVVILNDLYVIEQARGLGTAQQLFTACREYAEVGGFAAMSWETAQDNKRAQRFYEKMGGVQGDWLTYSIELEK